MANGADGSIVIDTSLDNTGFERGSQNMERAIKGVTQAVNESGRAAANGMQPLLSACQQVGTAANAAAQNAGTMGAQLSEAVSSSDFGKSMTAAGRACSTLGNQLQRLGDTERVGIKTETQMTRFQIGVERARNSAEQLEQELEKLGSQQVSTPEFEQLANDAKKAEAALFGLYDRRDVMQQLGVDENSREWQRLAVQIQNAEYTLDSYENSMKAMESSGTAYTSGANSAKYQEMAATLQDMKAQLASYEQTAAGFDTISAPAASSEAALKDVDAELKQEPTDASTASSALSGFGSTLRNAASSALHAAGSFAKMSFKGIASGARKAVSGIKGLIGKMRQGSSGTKGFIKALTSLKTMLLSRLKRTFIQNIVQSVKSSLSSLAQYSSAFNDSMSSMKNAMTGLSANIGVTFGNLVNAVAPAITTIINLISKAVSYLNAFFSMISGKGTVTVAKKQTDSYAKSLGGAAGAAEELKNEVYGFDDLNKESSESGGGGGGGGGTSDLYEDVAVASLLPESIQNIFTSIKDAFNAGEFEKIGNILAGGLNSITTTIDDWVNNTLRPFAVTWTTNITRILNGLIEGFDWANFGNLIADCVNTVCATLNAFATTFDWDGLANGIAAGINGLFDGVDWALLGQLVGNGISSLKNLIWGTLANIDWITLGSGLATGVNNAFSSVDWAKYATNVSDSIKGIIDGISTTLAEIDWQQIGNDVATFIGNIDWSGLCSSLVRGVGVALGSLASLVWGLIETAWGEVVTSWNEKMEANGGDVIQTLLDSIVTALADIGTWCLDNIITPLLSGIESALGLEQGTIAETATQLWTDFKSAVETAWTEISSKVTEFFSGVWTTITDAFGTLADTAKGIWDNFQTNIQAGWDNEKSPVENVLSGVWTTIKGAFGTLADTAKGIWDNFQTNIQAGWDNEKSPVENVLSGVWTTITGAFGKLSDIASGIWDGFSTGLSTAWNGVSESVKKVFTDAWGVITGVFSDVATVATNLWEGLKDGLATGWTNFKDTILQPFKDMWQAVKDFFGIASPSTEAESIGGFILEGLGSGLSAGLEAVLTVVSDVFGSIWDAIKSIFGFGKSENTEAKDAKQAGEDIMTGMKDGITGNEEDVKTAIKDAGKNALKALRTELDIPENGGASGKMKTIGQNMVTGISDGLTDNGTESNFTSAASSVWSGIQSAFETALGSGGGGWLFSSGGATNAECIGEDIVSGIDTGISNQGIEATFTTSASTVWTAIEDALETALDISDNSAGEAEALGEATVSGVNDGISNDAKSSTFTSVANSLRDAVLQAFKTALGISGGGLFSSSSSSKFKDIGKAICQGVADGINSNTSTIKTAAKKAAEAALKAAKDKLGIKSPSRAFAEIGGYMMEGMSNGIEAEEGTVLKTVSTLAGTLADSAISAPAVELTSNALVSGMDTVANKLSGIATTFTSIADALASVGGLYVPSIAAGTVVPYMTRVATENVTASKSDPFTAFSTNFNETMSDQRDLLRELIEVLRGKNMTIDGDSLAKSLTYLQRSQLRSYGGV